MKLNSSSHCLNTLCVSEERKAKGYIATRGSMHTLSHDGDGFFLTCHDLGGRFDNSFYFLSFFGIFCKWRSACAHQFHFSGLDQSTVAQQAEMIVAKSVSYCKVSSNLWNIELAPYTF